MKFRVTCKRWLPARRWICGKMGFSRVGLARPDFHAPYSEASPTSELR